MSVRVFGRPWKILNYVVNEPNEWTIREISEDLEEDLSAMVTMYTMNTAAQEFGDES